jgi:3-isopropylmalate/(R)-2-methylmalate dehydratase large subunit
VTQPGKTIVCGDSHTSTDAAFGALAFGIGTTEVGHVFATQCLLQKKPKTFAVEVSGRPSPGVTPKDLILAIIGRVGVSGGTGHVFEYRGEAIRVMSMEERMTVCNMSIEAGARAGMIAPDEVTYAYLADRSRARPRAPTGRRPWPAGARCRVTPVRASTKSVQIDAAALEPMVTYGTNPGMVAPVSGNVPDRRGDPAFDAAMKYMGLNPGEPIRNAPVDVVFVGSCTNGRLSDLRAAAAVLRGHKVASGVHMPRGTGLPGGQATRRGRGPARRLPRGRRRMARVRLLDRALGMNGDTVGKGEYSVSTSNRNFEGRQGVGARTLLASPETAAASAIRGRVTDPREFLNA